jgi:hypothetical protein
MLTLTASLAKKWEVLTQLYCQRDKYYGMSVSNAKHIVQRYSTLWDTMGITSIVDRINRYDLPFRSSQQLDSIIDNWATSGFKN